jgi:hypothetical protein
VVFAASSFKLAPAANLQRLPGEQPDIRLSTYADLLEVSSLLTR